jgi:broad specificity phosphatase PhoE
MQQPTLIAHTGTTLLCAVVVTYVALADASFAAPTRVYLVRHGLAVHNVLEPPGHCLDLYVLDPPLVAQGRLEALNAGHAFAINNVSIDIVFSSPLFRALQTTALLLRAGWGDAALSYRPAAPVVAPPVHIEEFLRERGSACTADWRRPVSEAARQFPGFNFSSLSQLTPPTNEDAFREWEPLDKAAERAATFMDFIHAFSESRSAPSNILLVSHASFLDDIIMSHSGLVPVATTFSLPYSYDGRHIRNGEILVFDLFSAS